MSNDEIKAQALLALSQVAEVVKQIGDIVEAAPGEKLGTDDNPYGFKTFLDDDLIPAYNTGRFQQVVLLEQVHRDLRTLNERQERLQGTLETLVEKMSPERLPVPTSDMAEVPA